MKKYTSEIKRTGREVTNGQSRNKLVKQYNKNGFEIWSARPSREKEYVGSYETFRG